MSKSKLSFKEECSKGFAFGSRFSQKLVLATIAYPLSLLGWVAGFLYRKIR